MKYCILILFTFIFVNSYSQDVILKTDGTSIEVKIDKIYTKNIKYSDLDNLSGDFKFISKENVAKILFENGETHVYATDSEIIAAKDKIMWAINNYALEFIPPFRKYTTSFVDDYLRLLLINKDGSKERHKILLYDFSNVIQFDPVSKRLGGRAFINIWLKAKKKEYPDRWVKYKMILYVKGHEQAEIIFDALQEYNRLLITRK